MRTNRDKTSMENGLPKIIYEVCMEKDIAELGFELEAK
jgi:hypothetical protein